MQGQRVDGIAAVAASPIGTGSNLWLLLLLLRPMNWPNSS
jgi:hypothetical protein